jgi:hypothetical protein
MVARENPPPNRTYAAAQGRIPCRENADTLTLDPKTASLLRKRKNASNRNDYLMTTTCSCSALLPSQPMGPDTGDMTAYAAAKERLNPAVPGTGIHLVSDRETGGALNRRERSPLLPGTMSAGSFPSRSGPLPSVGRELEHIACNERRGQTARKETGINSGIFRSSFVPRSRY